MNELEPTIYEGRPRQCWDKSDDAVPGVVQLSEHELEPTIYQARPKQDYEVQRPI